MTVFRIAFLFTCLAAAGCAAVQPERSAGRQLDDFNASLAIKSAMLRADGYVLERIDVEVTEGVALLTGSAPRAEDRVYAECVAWSAPSVRSVNNTVAIGAGRNAGAVARDAWITQQVRARLASDLSIRSVNFNIETHSGAVHLLGFARSTAERDRAAAHAAEVSGVVRVIDLVRVAGETPDLPARGAQQAAACDLSGGQAVDINPPLDTLMDEASPSVSPES